MRHRRRQGGEWANTGFLLTWDDWGGFDDHKLIAAREYTPDNVQVSPGPRVPLIMFGGHVKGGIDSRLCIQTAIPKTAIQLLGLGAPGVPRLDNDPGLADRVDPTVANPTPPAFGTTIIQPAPPSPTPPLTPTPTPTYRPRPLDPIYQVDGGTLPPPNDAPLPQQPNPPAAAITTGAMPHRSAPRPTTGRPGAPDGLI